MVHAHDGQDSHIRAMNGGMPNRWGEFMNNHGDGNPNQFNSHPDMDRRDPKHRDDTAMGYMSSETSPPDSGITSTRKAQDSGKTYFVSSPLVFTISRAGLNH
jgi:hypothetical protein